MDKQKNPDFDASSMIVVYSSKNEHHFDSQTYYLETHKIEKGKPGPGKPISIEAIGELKKALSALDGKQMVSIAGIIPQNLLYINSDPSNRILIWWTAPQQRKLFFDHIEVTKKVKSGKAELPFLLYVFEKEELSVFVLKEQPTMKSKIFYAPFPNIHYDSDVCMGNVQMEFDTSDIQKLMKLAENGFLNSNFNTVHDNRLCKVDIHTFWEKSIQEKLPFDYTVLVEHENYSNLKDLIDGKED